METNYCRNYVRDGKYVTEEVKECSYDLQPLVGNAVITHIGGNGRFMFMIGSISYTSTFVPNVAHETDALPGYLDCSKVVFDRDVKKEWSDLYIGHKDAPRYWRAI